MSFYYRYKFCPQMRHYDRIKQVWLPYLMHFHEPHYKSDVLNTDSRGFRLVAGTNSSIVADFAHAPDQPVCVLAGGSTVFGVGATSDATTIPSLMNKCSYTLWYNFGGRAYGSTQEFMLFLLHLNFLQQIEKVIVLSGINNLILYYLSRYYPRDFGPFFYMNQFYENMTGNTGNVQGGRPKSAPEGTFLTKLKNWRRLWSGTPALDANEGPNLMNSGFYTRINDHDAEKGMILRVLQRDITNWKLLSKALGFKMYYVLQPLANCM